jgi:hypothetical protein
MAYATLVIDMAYFSFSLFSRTMCVLFEIAPNLPAFAINGYSLYSELYSLACLAYEIGEV